MSEQNQGPTPQGQGTPKPERNESAMGAFIRNNLAWLIPLGLILLFFLIPATRHWISNAVRCSLLGSKEGPARLEACRQYLEKESFASAPCYEDCTEAVDYENARSSRSYQLLRAYVDKYIDNARSPRYQEIFTLLDSVMCENISRQASETRAASCRTYKDEFGQAGACYDVCHTFLDAFDCEAAMQAPNRQEAYLNYIDKYGREGKCYEAFREALEKGVPANMEDASGPGKTDGGKAKASTASTPAKTAPKKAQPASSRNCQTFTVGNQRFKAIKLGPLWWTAENMNKGGLVNWPQARDLCPTGWRLPCTREVEHLIHEFYSNPDKAYFYLTSQDARNCEFNLEFTGFAWASGGTTSNAGQVAGFWCMDDFGPTSTIAGSYVFRKNDKAIEILPNTEKSMGLNCRCVKESDAYKRSSLRFTPCVGMP